MTQMIKTDLLRSVLKEQERKLSQHAIDFVKDYIDELIFEGKEEDDYQNLLKRIYNLNEIIWTADAYNYLMEENIKDFKDAIRNGCKYIEEIANFYLAKELMWKFFMQLKIEEWEG